MNSIKAKFTLTLAIALLGVVSLLSVIVYYVNVNVQGPITPDVLADVGNRYPRVQTLLEKINANQTLSEVYDLVRKDQIEKFANVLIVFIPFTIFISVLFSYIVSLYVLKPIEDLAVNLKRIGFANLSQRIPETKSSTEIEYLTHTFNNLLDEVENAFTCQDQFIQDAAHELRTPIAAIKTSIQVYNDSANHTAEEATKLISKIEKINNKLSKLTESLLFLSKTSKLYGNIKKTSVNEAISEVIESVAYLTEEKNIRIQFNEPKYNLYSNVDPYQFSIVIKNIIENAIKYSHPDSEVKIDLLNDKQTVSIVVHDTGIGITDTDKARIFDRFYRSQNTIVNNEEGEGLGLSIVKKILDVYNAKILVQSEVGKGSTFTLIFPIAGRK